MNKLLVYQGGQARSAAPEHLRESSVRPRDLP